jgi:hypothetical protein
METQHVFSEIGTESLSVFKMIYSCKFIVRTLQFATFCMSITSFLPGNCFKDQKDIIQVMTSSRIRWVGYVARMGERRDLYRGLV